MKCMHCNQTFQHSHLTKNDELHISALFKKAEEIVPTIKKDNTPCTQEIREERERKYKDQCGDRANKVVALVDSKLVEEGKRVKFPVPEGKFPYEEYL